MRRPERICVFFVCQNQESLPYWFSHSKTSMFSFNSSWWAQGGYDDMWMEAALSTCKLHVFDASLSCANLLEFGMASIWLSLDSCLLTCLQARYWNSNHPTPISISNLILQEPRMKGGKSGGKHYGGYFKGGVDSAVLDNFQLQKAVHFKKHFKTSMWCMC